MNNRGIELAASFIVVLIISIIVFGLAAGITYRLFCVSGEKIDQLDEKTEKLVEQKLDSGAKVQVPLSAKSAKGVSSFCGSGSAAGASYTLGIRNDLISPASFSVLCDYKGIDTATGYVSGSGSCSANVLMPSSVDLDPKQKVARLIVVNAPPEKGKHVFTISVECSASTDCPPSGFYGAANIYLTVT